MTQGDFDRLHYFIETYAHLNMPKIEPHELTELYIIHNKVLPTEYNKACPACKERVWGGLKTYYHDNKNRYGY